MELERVFIIWLDNWNGLKGSCYEKENINVGYVYCFIIFLFLKKK